LNGIAAFVLKMCEGMERRGEEREKGVLIGNGTFRLSQAKTKTKTKDQEGNCKMIGWMMNDGDGPPKEAQS
jgi:hypothetical protein